MEYASETLLEQTVNWSVLRVLLKCYTNVVTVVANKI